MEVTPTLPPRCEVQLLPEKRQEMGNLSWPSGISPASPRSPLGSPRPRRPGRSTPPCDSVAPSTAPPLASFAAAWGTARRRSCGRRRWRCSARAAREAEGPGRAPWPRRPGGGAQGRGARSTLLARSQQRTARLSVLGETRQVENPKNGLD